MHAAVNNCSVQNLLDSQNGDIQSTNSGGSPCESGSVEVTGFNVETNHAAVNSENIPVGRCQSGGGSSDWRSTLYSRGPVNNPNMSEAQFRAFTQSGDYVPMNSLRSAKFLKGGYRKNSGKNKKGKKTKGKRTKYNKRGGGSDWRSTVYSRGSYTAPNMDPRQFRAFTQTADYIPNESMRTAAFMK